MKVGALVGNRHAAVGKHQTGEDWAMQDKEMLSERYTNGTQVSPAL